MTLHNYNIESARTFTETGDTDMDQIHMLLGMQTEVAEIADAYKKTIAYGKELDLINIREEVGDLIWYISNFCRINKFDMESILDTNIAKLNVRYPEKFTNERALERDLNAERKTLEQ